MEAKNIRAVNNYVTNIVKKLHPKPEPLIFLGGSFSYGKPSPYSDIDYTVVIKEKFDHSIFKFELVKLNKIVRLLSIYFYYIDDILMPKENLGVEEYLWHKDMMPQTTFVYGDRKLFNKICDLYKDFEYTKSPNQGKIHKSLGKLFELLSRIKKFEQVGNEMLMIYYGNKLAEHVLRLVKEYNNPIHVRSENFLLDTIFNLKKTPKDFKDLYLKINRYTLEGISKSQYVADCKSLTENVLEWIKFFEHSKDIFTYDLLKSSYFKEYFSNI